MDGNQKFPRHGVPRKMKMNDKMPTQLSLLSFYYNFGTNTQSDQSPIQIFCKPFSNQFIKHMLGYVLSGKSPVTTTTTTTTI